METLKKSEESKNRIQKKKRRPQLRIIAFMVLCCLVLLLAGEIFQKVFGSDAETDVSGIVGFYDLPENSLQTVVLGASIAGCGVNTPQLYEDYGICAYNLSVSWQPIMASYYWAKEAYRLHSETLTTILLDVSTLRHGEEELEYYKASLDLMKFSPIKLEAVLNYTESPSDAITNLVPLFYYHDRWAGNLTKSDLSGFKYEPENVLGYTFFYDRYLDNEEWDDMWIKDGILDDTAGEAAFGEEAVYYLGQLILFCKEKGIELVLIKTPHSDWTSSCHNAVQKIADQYDLSFLDFNFSPLLDEIEFNLSADTMDGSHSNLYGATKITSYLGQWLTDNTNLTDVRDRSEYSFMDEYIERYHRRVRDVMELKETTDPTDYIEMAMENQDNEIFLVVRDSINAGMTSEQRERFANMGLSVLSSQTYGSSYIGVVSGGAVAYESTIYFDYDEYNAEMEATGTYEVETLTYSTMTSDGAVVILESGGFRIGNVASCVIDGTEYAGEDRGLYVVVYNTELRKVIDTALFDLYESSEREAYDIESSYREMENEKDALSDLSEAMEEYVLYNRRTQLSRVATQLDISSGSDGLLDFLTTYMEMEDLVILLSVKDEASESLNREARSFLYDLGLEKLSKIKGRESYVGVIHDGKVIYEETDAGEEPITYSSVGLLSVISGGFASGNISSIVIGGEEYSSNERGINIVVYDLITGTVTDQAVFDTYAISQHIPE